MGGVNKKVDGSALQVGLQGVVILFKWGQTKDYGSRSRIQYT